MSDEMLIARLNAPVEISDYISISKLVIAAKQASSKLFDYEKQLAKQQEEIERLTILSNWLIALSDNGCVINSHKFSQSELTKLLAKHKKGD